MSMRKNAYIQIYVTLVQDKGNESSGNDIRKIATHSRLQAHWIFFCHVGEGERKLV